MSVAKPKARSRPKTRTKAAPDACAHCGKPARKLEFGQWRFCRARCRAAYLTARSRKAATAGKKLRCPLCGKGNPAKARKCAHCKARILWHERSPIWVALVWTFRAWLLLSLAGIGYMVYQFRDMGSMLGGTGDPAGMVSLLSPPGAAGGSAGPKVPGPGTWLLAGAGMPPLLLGEDPVAGTLFPPGFGTMGTAEKGKAMLGLVTSGKIKPFFGPTRIRLVNPGEAFSQVEVIEGSRAGTGGWALNAQIVSKD